MSTIANMTLEELMRVIDQAVDRRMERLLGVFELAESEEDDGRTLEEVYASIDRNMWTPPPDAPSTTELLREDRER
jgi:hypothetical protein